LALSHKILSGIGSGINPTLEISGVGFLTSANCQMQNELSLCIIAGNSESVMRRFLAYFSPLASEINVVIAPGNREPDQTEQICMWHGCNVQRYTNKIDWPHVDDFGAARNQATQMATKPWVMWADTDDMIDADSIQQIHSLLKDLDGKEIDGVLMPYVVPEDGVINWRERIWRRGTAEWQHPIHECLKFSEESKLIRFDSAKITHESEKRSPARDERNLRILESIAPEDRTISQKFHIFQSLIALDRNAEAITAALEFAQLQDTGKNERYEAFFQLARLAGDPAVKKSMLLQALATDPTRPEAYGELGLASVPDDPTAALGWTEAMLAFKVPQEAPWNLRRTYYGHLGKSLRSMALRRNGRDAEADALQDNHFIQSGAKISLLHATRGRPALAWRQRMDWLRLASDPDSIEHIFAVDADDEESAMLCMAKSVIVGESAGPVAAWNLAAKFSKGKVLVQMSDDFEAFAGWDKAILNALGDLSKPSVLAVSDGHRKDNLMCMAILTRKRYEDQGYLFHPEFFSMYSDNWFTDLAYHDDVVIDASNSIIFEHRHPAFGIGEMDNTYARSNSYENHKRGRSIFNRLSAGVKIASDVPGWCDYKAFYSAIAKAIPDGGTFVEIGSWMGQSIIHFCQELQNLGKTAKVTCIDTFKGELHQPEHVAIVESHGGSILNEFKRNIADAHVDHMIEIIEGDSAESAANFPDQSCDVIFIDAAHDYDSVVKDIAAWKLKVKPNGIFSGHDYPCDDVKKAVDEYASSDGCEINQIGRVWIKNISK